MTTSMMHLAPNLLVLFMLVLAGVPLALAWQDGRRRAAETLRVRGLRHEARLVAELRARAPLPGRARAQQGTASGAR